MIKHANLQNDLLNRIKIFKKKFKSYKGTLPEYKKWNNAIPKYYFSNIRNLELGKYIEEKRIWNY